MITSAGDDSRIFFDVTQLVHWQGRLTGIPRVMNELAVRFARRSDTVFVSWVKEIEQFCEIDFTRTMAEHSIMYIEANQTVSSATVSRQKLQLKKQVTSLAKRALRRGAHFSPLLMKQIEERLIRARLSRYKIAVSRPGDRLFIPWGEWWDERFTKKLLTMQRSGVKLIQIIHDIATTVCPQFYEQVAVNPTSYNSQILPVADLVLVVSENTKREVVQWLKENGLTVPTIKVFRNGEDLPVVSAEKPHDVAFTNASLKGGDFLLTVGTIELKKNHHLYYYAYKLAKARGIELPPLVVVGRKGWMGETALTLMSKDPEVKDKFIILHDTNDQELSWLYDHCLFTMLASFHEGWGIPIAESVSRGVPCLCSNTGSMTEIAEGFVKHFSPASSDELLAGIQHLLNQEVRQKACEKIKQYRQFSWDETYKQVAESMESN